MSSDDETIRAATSVAAHEIGADGIWCSDDGSMCDDLYNITFQVPENVGRRFHAQVGESREVLTVLDAEDYHYRCPNCRKRTKEGTFLIVLEDFHIYVGWCCDKLVWVPNKGSRKWESEQQ